MHIYTLEPELSTANKFDAFGASVVVGLLDGAVFSSGFLFKKLSKSAIKFELDYPNPMIRDVPNA